MLNKKKNVKYIKKKNKIYAIILKSDFSINNETIEFFTPSQFSQQLGYMNRPKNYLIEPHLHNKINRKVDLTNEVLIIKSGKVRVDFYDQKKKYFESRVLKKGDIILLAFGGHGFKMLEPSEIIEIKQGPYAGEKDKLRFNQVENFNINIKK